MFSRIGKRPLAALSGAVVLAAVVLAWALSGDDDGEIKVRTEAVKVTAPPLPGASEVGRGTKTERKRAARIAKGEYVPEPGSEEEKAFKSTDKTLEQMSRATKVWTDEQLGTTVRDALLSTAHDESFAEICELMSASARKQTIVYSKRSSGIADILWNCEKAVSLLVRRSHVTGDAAKAPKAEVVGMNVEGDLATATIKFGDQPASSVSLVKEDGEWKLGASPEPSE